MSFQNNIVATIMVVLFLVGCSHRIEDVSATEKDMITPVTVAQPPGGVFNSVKEITLVCSNNKSSCVDGSTYYSLTDIDVQPVYSIYSKPIPLPNNGSSVLRYYSIDSKGKKEIEKTEFYTIDTILPAAIVMPIAGSTINKTSQIYISFSESMDVNSLVLNGDIAVEVNDENWSDANVGNDIVSLRPLSIWTFDSTRNLIIDVADNAGNALPTLVLDYVIDDQIPTANVMPLPGLAIQKKTKISITFSESMNIESLVVTGNMFDSDLGEFWSSSLVENDTVTFSPPDGWVAGLDKGITVNITDLANNAVVDMHINYNVLSVNVLNDTGVTLCANADSTYLVCNDFGDGTGSGFNGGTTKYLGQDAEHGRDSLVVKEQLLKIGNGQAAFDFTKFDKNGIPLKDQTAIYTLTPWSCVLDNVTGLIWEVKTGDPSATNTPEFRGGLSNYSWYSSNIVTNGGDVGSKSGGACSDGILCYSENYINAVNSIGLCGFSDWRLPNLEELRSIVDYSVVNAGAMIDSTYFPNTVGDRYWSSNPDANDIKKAWTMSFSWTADFGSSLLFKSDSARVRLVRNIQ